MHSVLCMPRVSYIGFRRPSLCRVVTSEEVFIWTVCRALVGQCASPKNSSRWASLCEAQLALAARLKCKLSIGLCLRPTVLNFWFVIRVHQ